MQMKQKKLQRANTEAPTQIWVEFPRSFLRRHLGEKPVVTSPNVGCFLRLCPPPPSPLHYLDDWKQFHLGNEVTAIALASHLRELPQASKDTISTHKDAMQ